MNIGKIKSIQLASSSLSRRLLELANDAPSRLFVIGELPIGDTPPPIVAIVGTRQPSPYGRETTYRLAYDLAKSGVTVVSGLAHGIDTIAHRATLDAGGRTIAVLAGGLHRIYPAGNRQLARDIIRGGGAILSENDTGYEAKRYDFLIRNRLISGLADAVIVTEATEKSGTLSTVAAAIDQNRDIFAVPGAITSLVSAGPNRLIQQGAHVVLSADDVLNVVAPQLVQQHPLPIGDTPLQNKILKLITSGVRDGDELLRRSEAGDSEFLQEITMMELHGVIRHLGANRWTIS